MQFDRPGRTRARGSEIGGMWGPSRWAGVLIRKDSTGLLHPPGQARVFLPQLEGPRTPAFGSAHLIRPCPAPPGRRGGAPKHHVSAAAARPRTATASVQFIQLSGDIVLLCNGRLVISYQAVQATATSAGTEIHPSSPSLARTLGRSHCGLSQKWMACPVTPGRAGERP